MKDTKDTFEVFRERGHAEKVRPLLLRIINNHATLNALAADQRLEKRVNLCLAAIVVPIQGGQHQLDEAFASVTKDLSSQSVSFLVKQHLDCEEVIIGLQDGPSLTFFRGRVTHRNELSAGFCQIGVEFMGIAHPGDYPGLSTLDSMMSLI